MRSFVGTALVAASLVGANAADAADPQVERGEYLVTIAGCNDCHTPGYFLGKPDFSRRLGGSDVGFAIPGVGASVGPNLTPDKETELGAWTDDQIIAAFTKGVTPNGRKLSPVMPWQELAALTPDDAKAIVAYLRSRPPVNNPVPGPFAADQTPSTLVFVIVPGADYAKMPKPQNKAARAARSGYTGGGGRSLRCPRRAGSMTLAGAVIDRALHALAADGVSCDAERSSPAWRSPPRLRCPDQPTPPAPRWRRHSPMR